MEQQARTIHEYQEAMDAIWNLLPVLPGGMFDADAVVAVRDLLPHVNKQFGTTPRNEEPKP